MLQRGRVYQLGIGNYKTGDGLLIEDLEITFNIVKNSDNTQHPDRCSIKIYNLSETSLKVFETDYSQAVLLVGYEETGLKQLYGGNVTLVSTRKIDTDRVTEIQLNSGYVELNHTLLNKVIPAGKVVKDIIEEIRKAMPSVSRGVYAGKGVRKQCLYGYSLSDSPRQMLDELSRAYQIEWRVDNDILYVNDIVGIIPTDEGNVPVISRETGLIEIPYYRSGNPKRSKKDDIKKKGIKFKALLNPEVKPGSYVQIDDPLVGNTPKQFKVDQVKFTGDFRGDAWFMDVFCATGGNLDLANSEIDDE